VVSTWIVKRSAERKGPGDLEPTLLAVIDRYIAESNNAVLGTKAQVLLSRERTYGAVISAFVRSGHQNDDAFVSTSDRAHAKRR
jgi:hypothetical protein